MKKYLNKTNIIILLVVATIAYFVFQPSLPKKLLEIIRKSLVVEDETLKKQIDSINNVRLIDKNKYESDLRAKDIEIQQVSVELKKANVKIRRYELQILDYRNGTYNERFVVFTRLITETDSIWRK